jgi:outer membrane usher protein
LSGQHLRINPDSEGRYLAQSDWLGPAVVPELSSYNPTTLVVGAKDLPLGTSIPQDHFTIFPRYKSGFGFPLGNDANLYLLAKLTDSQGKPLEMVTGLVTNLDDLTAAPITIFTSRKGIVQSEGFRAGRYVLEVGSDQYAPLEFVVPETAKEEYDLGTVKLRDKDK